MPAQVAWLACEVFAKSVRPDPVGVPFPSAPWHEAQLATIDRLANFHLRGGRVQGPGICHRVPDLLIVEAVLPGRHHALHIAVLGDVEQLGERFSCDFGVFRKGGGGHAQAGSCGAITLACFTVAGRAILGVERLAVQRLRRRKRGILGRRHRRRRERKDDQEK